MTTAAAEKREWRLEDLIRPRTMIDLVLKADILSDQIDVRKSMVLDVSGGTAVLAQTSPPLLKSMTGRQVEATFVRYDQAALKHVRLGWASRILELDNHYRLVPGQPDSPAEAVALLEIPAEGTLYPANVRLDHRLTVPEPAAVGLKCRPWPGGRPRLINFSAGGLLVAARGRADEAPPELGTGREVKLELSFPGYPPLAGEAEVVRIEHDLDRGETRLGLKFIDLGREASRTLQKVIYSRLCAERR